MTAMIQELADAGAGWDRIFAILGPPASGKTSIIRAALSRAELEGVRTAYIDLRQAREIWELNDFYTWLTRAIKAAIDRDAGAKHSKRAKPDVSPRVLWCDAMEQCIARTRTRLLIALDHFESIADSCAHDLTSDLREIQDKAGSNDLWSRFRCVLGGTISVFKLRRLSASPNLQFHIKCLPSWAAEADGDIRGQLAATARTIDDDAVPAIAAATMGEAAFVDILSHYLPASHVALPDVDNAVELAAKDGMRFAELSWPATLYALDREFRERADDLIAGRPATWCDASTDIDPYQLAGAIVVGDAMRRQARFRNGLVRKTVAALQAGSAANADDSKELARVPCWLLQQRCLQAATPADLLEAAAASWHHLTRVTGMPVLLLRDPVEKTRGFLIDQSAITVEQRPPSVASQLEVKANRLQVDVHRVATSWVVDTFLGNHLTTGIRIRCGDEFVPTVAMRDVLRLWALFLEPFIPNIERLGLDALGNAALRGKLPHGGRRVFVSSTYLDLQEHRRLAMEQVIRRDMLFRGMEHFGADPDAPSIRLLEEVREADVYVGIFGVRYGSIDARSGLSMTELEFREAESLGMPMLLYVLRSDADVKRQHVEMDPESMKKLAAFLEHIKRTKYVYEFGSPADLGRQLYTDLGKYV